MKNIFKKVDDKVLRMICDIGRAADERGVRAFIVGGFVRDFMMKRKSMDLDIVIEGDAISFAQEFSQKKKLRVEVHQRFGTAVIHDWNGLHVDCVSARAEKYIRPGALPSVRRSTIDDDINRRDFTINALAVSISKNDFGRVVDFCNGISDLKKGVIRVFHDQSFIDDPTRILRAVRFEQRFGFQFSTRTRRLLNEAISNQVESTVSAPRYFQEFVRGLMEEHPAKYLRRLRMLTVLDFLKLKKMPNQQKFNDLDSLRKRWRKKFLGKNIDWESLYLGVLFSQIGSKKVLEYVKDYQWSRIQKKKVGNLIEAYEKFKLLKNKGLRCCEVQDFLESQPDEIMFFIRAMTSGKILISYLDHELRMRNSKCVNSKQ